MLRQIIISAGRFMGQRGKIIQYQRKGKGLAKKKRARNPAPARESTRPTAGETKEGGKQRQLHKNQGVNRDRIEL